MKTATAAFVAMMGAGLLASGAARAAEANFPSKPLTIVVPTAPGGGWDVDAQFVRAEWSKRLGQTINIRYEPAGGGIAALEQVARDTEPYEIVVIGSEFAVINLYSQHSTLTMTKDFYPVQNMSTDVMTVFVGANSPYHGINDLVADAKKQRISMGVAGVGSSNQLMALILRQVTGVGANLNIVPINGGAILRTEIAGGHLAAGVSPSQGLVAFQGQIRPIGYFSDKNPTPDFLKTEPVAKQIGKTIPNMAFSSAFFVSMKDQKNDPAAVAKLVSTFKATVNDPGVVATIQKASYMPYADYLGPDGVEGRLKSAEAAVQQYGSLFSSK